MWFNSAVLLFILFKVLFVGLVDFFSMFLGLLALSILPFVLLILTILLSSGRFFALSTNYNSKCFLLFCFFNFKPFGFKMSSRFISLVGCFLDSSIENFSNFYRDKDDFMSSVFLLDAGILAVNPL